MACCVIRCVGQVRMYLQDHPGWFVSETFVSPEDTAADAPEGASFVSGLLDGIPNSLLLQNDSQELRVLVANHDVRRPALPGEPFSKLLLFNRTSEVWKSTFLDTRCYMYDVHASRTMLLSHSLDASFYLIVLRFLARDYVETFNLIDGINVDVDLSMQEMWALSQFKGILDAHPDAHAIRLKLGLSQQYSKLSGEAFEQSLGWRVHNEYHSYLEKVTHVSASCRLTQEQELDIIKRGCREAGSIITNRLQCLQQPAGTPIQMANYVQNNGGRIWGRMLLDAAYKDIDEMRAENRLRYARLPVNDPPKPEDGNGHIPELAGMSLLFQGSVMEDDLGGASRQLGFLFLYELLRGDVTVDDWVDVNGRNSNKTLAELLIRSLHLKLSHWGRDHAGDGS